MHEFNGLGTIALCTAGGMPLCFSGCKFGVLASDVKERSSFLILTFCYEREKVISEIFPCIIYLFSIHLLTPEIYDKQHGVMSSSGSGKSPVPEREVVSDKEDHTLNQALSAPLLDAIHSQRQDGAMMQTCMYACSERSCWLGRGAELDFSEFLSI